MKFIIEHLEKHFEKKEVLRDIDFTFESGRIYGLLGRNGAGKTTLFNCLNRDGQTAGAFTWKKKGPGGKWNRRISATCFPPLRCRNS